MIGAERRKMILALMKESSKPLSGGALGAATGVSRQVVVQDIALLRSEGYSILATARGYLLDSPKEEKASRLFKVFHNEALHTVRHVLHPYMAVHKRFQEFPMSVQKGYSIR